MNYTISLEIDLIGSSPSSNYTFLQKKLFNYKFKKNCFLVYFVYF